MVIGGPFEPHIEHIIRDRAFLMKSPVISSCDPGIRSVLKFSGRVNGSSYQTCDIFIKVLKDLQLVQTGKTFFSFDLDYLVYLRRLIIFLFAVVY